MNSTTATTTGGIGAESNPGKGLRVTLWTAQGLLALAFGAAGAMKLSMPIADLATNMAWVSDLPAGVVRFIGASELAGAVGLVVPGLTGIRPSLTALAAAGLTLVMILAAGFHVSRGEATMIAPNLVLGSLAAFVAWGRARRAPLRGRSAP